MSDTLTDDDVMARLREAIAEAGTQTAWAARAGVSDAYLSDVLRGNRRAGEKILAGLGLRRAVVAAAA